MALTDSNTWGALFIARTGLSLDEDRNTIITYGYTILEEERQAGQTYIFAYGPVSSVISYVGDFELKVELPGYFIKLPPNREITPSLVKSWTTKDRVVR